MRLVLSVGKNPLPVALAGLYFPDITEAYLVDTQETRPESDRIEKLWERRGFTAKVEKIMISPEPNRENERLLREKLPKNDLHFHYSGGTTAMALAISKVLPQVETSYVSLKFNRMFSDWSETPSEDLRTSPNTRLTLQELIELHGFFECTHCNARGIVPVTGRLAGLAEKAARWERDVRNESQKNPNTSNKFNYKRNGDSERPPVVFSTQNGEMAVGINEAFARAAFTQTADGVWRATLSPATSDFWDFVGLFKKGAPFEHKIQVALETALTRSLWNPSAVFHSVYLGRNARVLGDKDLFEADLIAVLGYQLLYVSCTIDGNEAKRKAFEAYHRARQLGGGGARALVVANLIEHDSDENDEALLHLEIGLGKDDRSVRIIRVDTPRATIAGLTNTIEGYLSTLAPEAA